MCSYEIVLMSVLLYFAMYLVVLGWTGIMTDTPLVYRLPLAFNRPTIYLMALAILFSDTLMGWLGCTGTLIAFLVLIADLSYETFRPFIWRSVFVVSESRPALERDLLGAIDKLNLKAEGSFPSLSIAEPAARLRVRYWPRLSIGEITISPRSSSALLTRIGETIEAELDSTEGRAPIRGYVLTVFAGFSLFLLAFWRYLSLNQSC